MEKEKVYAIIDELIEINEDLQKQIDSQKVTVNEVDIKQKIFDISLKDLDSRITKIEKDNTTKEINALLGNEGGMDFETSANDTTKKIMTGTIQQPLFHANVLENIILDQSDRERRSKNVKVFPKVSKYEL